jgi:eukaryotic-like serine/threonine-protein kinase
VLDRYRLGKRLGAGAFGTVWAATDERLEREVAVKVLPRHRIVGARFEREARAAARLQHPAIVTLYEAVVDDEGAYLVSELVRGRTLDELLERGHLSDRDILEIGISICDALIHAHDEGVIHRDVKPSNILVPARGRSAGHPAKLTDFGVARVVGGDTLTHTGDVVGTLAYMAPEQAEGREAGPAADLYSLALVVYEALTGVNPVRNQRPGPGRQRRLGTYLPPLRRQRRDLPRQLGAGVDLALRPRPRERGSLEELRFAFASSLEQVGEEPGIVVAAGDPEDATDEPWTTADRFQDRSPGARDPEATGPKASGAALRERFRFVPASEIPWPARAAGAAGAGLAAGWLSAHLLTSAPLAPTAVALVVAAATLLLPRLAWVLATLALALIATTDGRTGGAVVLVVAAGLSAAPLLLARHGTLLAAPAGAVLLGMLGLAGTWPAVLGRIRLTIYQRAALGAGGFLWLATASDLVTHPIYWRPPRTPLPGTWMTSPPITLHDVLVPLLSHGVLPAALVWAAAAVTLPWITGPGRSLPVQLVLVAMWSAITVSAVEAVGAHHLRGATLGAVLGALIALAPVLVRSASQLDGLPGLAPRVP